VVSVQVAHVAPAAVIAQAEAAERGGCCPCSWPVAVRLHRNYVIQTSLRTVSG